MNNCGIVLILLCLVSFGLCGFNYTEYRNLMKGYLKSIKIKPADIPHLVTCLTDDPIVQSRFLEIMDVIDKLDYTNLPLVADKLTELFVLLIRGVIDISDCTNKDSDYNRIFTKIYSMLPTTIHKRLMLNFISNPQQIFKDIEDAVNNYEAGKFEDVGVDLGDIVHLIITFAIDKPLINLENYLKIIKGIFKGLNVNHIADKILECIDSVPPAIEKIIVIIKQLNDIDFKDVKKLIEILMRVFKEMKEVFNSLIVCADSVPELKALLKKIIMVDITKLISYIIANSAVIISDLIKAKNAFLAEQYQTFGEIMGSLIYRLFLKAGIISIE